jgi:alginate O-acetyltransferase complex protein AlgI
MRIYFTLYLIPVLAVALLLYWVVLRGEKRRLVFLIAASLAVLMSLHPVFGVVVVGLALVTHRLVAWRRSGGLSTRDALIMGIALAVVTLGVGKYGQSLATSVWGANDWVTAHLIMPLGISYFVFRLLQYVFDQLRGVLQENSFLKLLAFLLFIPTFPAGPLETYQGFYGKRSHTVDRRLVYASIRRIALGYFKKAFVVDLVLRLTFGGLIGTVGSPGFSPSAHHPLMPLAFVIVVFLRAYLDLSAYTDLAIGFSGLFGFGIMENFDRPLLSKNLSDFWQRYHMSLSGWCRNNVYFPVFGATRKVWLGLYASMLTMGLWHYVNLNWTLWGLWHASGLVWISYWKGLQRKRRKAKKAKAARTPAEEQLSPAPVALGAYVFLAPIGMGKKALAWWPYAATFLYVSVGYSFAGTHQVRTALTVFAWCFVGPVSWLVHSVF